MMNPRQKRVVKKHEGNRIELHEQGTAGGKGEGTEDLATYMAFSLYVDFIYILIRVIYILLRIFGNKK